MTYLEKYEFLIDNSIATEEEINLVLRINGCTDEQLNNILFVRTGYSDFGSYKYYECSEYEELWDLVEAD